MTDKPQGKELYDRVHRMMHLVIEQLRKDEAAIGMIAMFDIITSHHIRHGNTIDQLIKWLEDSMKRSEDSVARSRRAQDDKQAT